VVDIAWINMGYTPGRFPVIEIADIPTLIKSADGGSRALQEWYAAIAEKEMADVKLCLVHLGPAGTIHAKKPVKRPADLKGLRVRPGSAALAQFIADNGGSAVQVAAPESRQALERGVADAITFPWGSLVLFGIDKTVSHHVDAPIYFVGAAQVINKASYAKLSPRQKQAIDGHCGVEAAGKFVTGWVAWEAEGRTKLGALPGHSFTALDAADIAAWQDAAKPLLLRWSEAVKKAGHDPDALLASFRAALAKHGAAN
jgi:TRAP-type C4-dicarboxylate transport system substrate-binding protein